MSDEFHSERKEEVVGDVLRSIRQSGRARDVPTGRGGRDIRWNNYIAEAAISPWKQKERRND